MTVIMCNTMYVGTISGIAFNGTSDHFIINIHLLFKILDALSTHILVEDWIKL